MKKYRCSSFCSFFKGEKFIQGYIQNMLEQSIFNEIEFIFLDCASPENEAQYIKPICQKYENVKYYRLEKDPGLYAGWNIAIKQSSSDIITNWNIDDRKSKNSFEILLNELEKNPDLDMVYGLTFVSNTPNETYELNNKQQLFKCEDHSFHQLIKHNSPHCMPMWRKSIHNKCGYFNEKYQSISDAEMWLRLCSVNGIIKKINHPIGLYYWNPNGRSTDEKFSDQNHKDLQEAKINILTNMNDIEKLLPPIKEYESLYFNKITNGKEYIKKCSNLFLVLANDIDKYTININKINLLLSLFKNAKMIIYEISSLNNKSSEQLKKLSNNQNISIINHISGSNKILYNQNYFLNEIINNNYQQIHDYDFVTFLDIKFIDISINGIYNSYGYLKDNSIDAISGFNIQKEIYDHVNRLFLINKNSSAYRLNFWSNPKDITLDYIYDMSFAYRMMTPVVGSPPTPVYSNYGGYITYRTKNLLNNQVSMDNDPFVSLNHAIYQKNNNAKFLINPSQLMLSYYDTE